MDTLFCRGLVIVSTSEKRITSTDTTMDKAETVVRRVSTCTIKAHCVSEQSQKPYYLTLMDLQFLTLDYIQTGLLFPKPQHIDVQSLLDKLKLSFSRTLTHFYPLSGRFVTKTTQDPPSYLVFVDCKDSPGAEFVHAISNLTISDILSPVHVPPIVESSFFALHQPINHDAHTLPILAVQVTELADGIFIGCSFNHVVADGVSFWHFFNCWSEISRATEQNMQSVSRPPITKRWFIKEQEQIINLSYSHSDEFIERFVPEPYKERIFHFTSESIAKLKAKANADLGVNKISSFQALSAQVWRSITRARGLSAGQNTNLGFQIDVRSRLEPPLPREYFGNCAALPCIVTTAGKLLSNNLGWIAWLLHNEITDHTNANLRSGLESQPSTVVPRYNNPHSVVFGMSPRFDVYTNDFGWGEPVAVRSGFGLKCDGKVTWYPGREGGGSMDLEICLNSETMSALEMDDEFMKAVSPPNREW